MKSNLKGLFTAIGIVLLIPISLSVFISAFNSLEVDYHQYDRIIEIMENPSTSDEIKDIIVDSMKDKKITFGEYFYIAKQYSQEKNRTGSSTLDRIIIETTN